MKKKRIFVMFLCTILMLNFCVPISAANKNVTKRYKKQVSKMLKIFDSYFGYGCGRGMKFKYDDYCRTTMVYLPNLYEVYGKSTSYAKKKLSNQVKLYFGTKTIKLKKFTKHTWPKNPSYLIQNKKGKITYVGGDWGEEYPKGTVKNIVQTSSSKFVVTYRMNLYSDYYKKNIKYMGTYKVYLKKANNKNGFIITNIKRTETKNVRL